MNDLMTKSFLSYVELKKQTAKESDADDLEAGQRLHLVDEQNLLEFFHEVEAIRSEMREITDLLCDLQNLNEQSKSTYSARALRGLRDRMESDTVTILRKANAVKILLGTLDRSNLSNRGIYKEGSPIDRTRMSVTNGLRVRLREMMNDFQSLRDKVVSDHREDMKRRYFNATGEEATEEVVDRVIATGGKIDLFGGKAEMMVGSRERHGAVMDIQRSLNKLHQVFLDMAVMVEAQGEKVEGIEENMARAGGYVSGGTNSLYYANQMRRKGKNWVHFWVWAVILVIVLVCLVSLLVS